MHHRTDFEADPEPETRNLTFQKSIIDNFWWKYENILFVCLFLGSSKCNDSPRDYWQVESAWAAWSSVVHPGSMCNKWGRSIRGSRLALTIPQRKKIVFRLPFEIISNDSQWNILFSDIRPCKKKSNWWLSFKKDQGLVGILLICWCFSFPSPSYQIWKKLHIVGQEN